MVWDGTHSGGFTTGRPWLPVKAPQLARNVAGQQGVEGSVLEFYRAMLALRKGSQALMAGKTVFHDLPEPLLAFTREAEGDALLCLFNLSAKAKTVNVQGTLAPLSASIGGAFSGHKLTLAPNAAVFLPVTGPVSVKM